VERQRDDISERHRIAHQGVVGKIDQFGMTGALLSIEPLDAPTCRLTRATEVSLAAPSDRCRRAPPVANSRSPVGSRDGHASRRCRSLNDHVGRDSLAPRGGKEGAIGVAKLLQRLQARVPRALGTPPPFRTRLRAASFPVPTIEKLQMPVFWLLGAVPGTAFEGVRRRHHRQPADL
jgi:hypothetical protein